jgi:metal-responsive CopG/Arc/MetJ family transcriptional regulator
MENGPKRFNISVSPELCRQLTELKERRYPDASRNEMLIDLIRKGLEATEGKKQVPFDNPKTNIH